MTSFPDPSATASEFPDRDPLVPETITLAVPPPLAFATDDDRTRAGRAETPVALVEGPSESLSGETHQLRRRRLGSAAVALAAINGLLSFWILFSSNPATNSADGGRLSLRLALCVARTALASAVAGLLVSRVAPRGRQLHIVECLLFLGLTALQMASFYFVGLDLVRRGAESGPMLLAFVKDGVLQMIILMVVYGTLVPNRPVAAARMLMVMFVGSVLARSMARVTSDATPGEAMLSQSEQVGTNVLYLAIGAVLSYYAARVLNGLRTELHDARKFGQYRLLRKIGSGGMGEVYLAEHQLLKRPCALKVIKPQAYANPTNLARFEREVRSAARLSHPNTIEIYDYGLASDGTFIPMVMTVRFCSTTIDSFAMIVLKSWRLHSA